MSTKIEWVRNLDGSMGETWNPTTGCSKVSAGCQNCYAERMAYRLRGRFGYPEDEPFRVTFHPERLEEPLHWRKPRRVFVNSMGDLFHPDVPDEFIDRVFMAMRDQKHIFLLLTKRPKRMHNYLTRFQLSPKWDGYITRDGKPSNACQPREALFSPDNWPLPNVWLGVTAENQQAADERIPLLLQTPAAVRFVSVEPMLGPVDLRRIPGFYFPGCTTHDALNGRLIHHDDGDKATPDEKLDWVIVGGETGPNARPCHPDWVRSLRDQAVVAGVPFFLKQMHIGGKLVKMPELDGRRWDELPRF